MSSFQSLIRRNTFTVDLSFRECKSTSVWVTLSCPSSLSASASVSPLQPQSIPCQHLEWRSTSTDRCVVMMFKLRFLHRCWTECLAGGSLRVREGRFNRGSMLDSSTPNTSAFVFVSFQQWQVLMVGTIAQVSTRAIVLRY
jgi:hypothetical protein